MKQKIIIGFSVGLLLMAVFLIAKDLFRKSPTLTQANYYADDYSIMKKFDTTLLGYTRIKTIETNLKDLSGIAIDTEQNIYVSGTSEVVVYDSTGLRIRGFGLDTMANCIAVNGNDLYLGIGAAVGHYDIFGKQLKLWTAYSAEGFVSSIAVNNNSVYVADAMSRRLLKYSTDGTLTQEIGRKDSITGATGFIIPSMYFDLTFGAFNDLWVVNPGRLQIENYSTSGYLQSVWGKTPDGKNNFTGCCNPAQFAILPSGSFVTYEKGIDMVKVFDPTGQFVCLVAGAGSFKGNKDFQTGGYNLVKDLAIASNGNIYILDAHNQINVFKVNDL